MTTQLLHLTGASSVSDVFEEQIEQSQADGSVRFRRRYHAQSHESASCVITSDPNLARRWASSYEDTDFASWARAHHIPVHGHSIPAKVSSCDDPRSSEAWLMEVARDTRAIKAAFPGIRSLGDRAWAHKTSVFTQNTRFVGPVFIGSGVELPDDAVVIGPMLLSDRAGVEIDEPLEVIVPGRKQLSWHWWPVVSDRPRRYRWTKRLFDIAFSLAGLIMTLPLTLVIALIILIEDGRPIFYKAKRQTIFGREFDCLKFRSMVNNADAMQAKLRQQSQNKSDGPQFHMDNDPRILKIGHIIRKTQLDEIPQFINVLKGDMSVVGPRPSPDRENQCCPSWREARLSVRAGVTGLWQVCRQRGEHTDFQEWIRFDTEYVEHRGWGLDLWIIFQTIWRLVPGFIRGKRYPVPPYARK